MAGNTKSFLERHGESPVVPVEGVKQCFAHGCPAYPTIHTGGEYACRWHYRRSGSILQHITRQLRANEDLIKWHDRIFSTSIVDFDLGVIAEHAPSRFKPQETESYSNYKKRIRDMIEVALYQVPGKE